MATNTLWQRTQLGFLPPHTSYSSQRLSSDHLPQRIPGLQVGPSQLSSQLQFNMGVPLSPENMATHFRKPKPIVIEKLEGPTQIDKNRTIVTRSMEGVSLKINSSALSSDRLAFAVNLARRDIKRAKLMPTSEAQVSNDEQVNKRHETPNKERTMKNRKGKREENAQPKETMRHRVQKTLRHQDKELQRRHELYFYPSTGHQMDTEGENNQAKEIRKLRKELHLYMNQLEDIQKDRPIVLCNKDKRLKRRQNSNIRLSDEEIDERQVARAEEQAARSSRMLYMVKRQVQDLQDELNKKGNNIKHTKKSQTLHRLAAAHRAAVRALQTFISQSPLHPKGGHASSYMYQDLAILVRQLSLLTTQLQVATDDELDDLVLDKTTAQQPNRCDRYPNDELRKQNAFYKETEGGSIPHQTLPSPPTKEGKQPPARTRGPNTPNPSPERDAVLRAGLQALVRAREEALNTKQPDHTKTKVQFSTRPLNPFPAKKSLLLPAHLKAKRQRAQNTIQRVKPADLQNAHFAKDTVASTLRKVPGQEKQGPVDHPLKSLPRTPTKSPPLTPRRGTPTKRFGTPERLCEQMQASPKSQRRKLEEEFKSPRSPKYQRQMLEEERNMLEREIARQAWLDREADLRLQEIEEDLLRRRHHHPGYTSEGVHLARQMIDETEEAIIHRLKPLLDRAEAIVKENKKQEERKKQSLQQQLTNLTSRTTMNQAHILADGILDDLLDDTVQELQRLEVDDEAEAVAAGIQNSSTLENVMHRLQSFEKVENEIRRHWTQVKYVETDVPTRTKHHRTEETDTKSQGARPVDPRPIMFTRDRPERNENYLESRIKQLRKRSQCERDKARFGQDDTIDSNSTGSLLDGISSPKGSDIPSVKEPSRRLPPLKGLTRPTIALFVPSELRASIASYRSKYERFLRDTATHVQGSFNPWKTLEQISEELLDDLIQDVVGELGNVCDEYTETIYKQEFVAAGGDKSITQLS